MIKTVELEPGDFKNPAMFRYTATEVVYGGVQSHLRNALGEMVTQPKFSASDVPDVFIATLADVAPVVLLEKLEYERNHTYEKTGPLSIRVGQLALGNISDQDLQLDAQFVANIEAQIRELPYSFTELQRYHDSWQGTSIFNLLSSVQDLQASKESDPDNWLTNAFNVVRSAADNPAEYTPPIEDPESLYLITFLPDETRGLTRRLLVNNHVSRRIETTLEDDLSETESAMLDALKQHFYADALTGQQWDDPASRYQLSDSASVEMAMLSVKNIEALSTLQKLAKTYQGKRFVQVWEQATSELDRLMTSQSAMSRVRVWQNSDTGHTFGSFRSYELYDALKAQEYGRNYNKPEKTKGRAVILEDDRSQGKIWLDMLDRFSAYTVSAGELFETPVEVDAVIDDPEVGLFLLDIQNGEDKTAGLRMAKKIFARRLEMAVEKIDSMDDPFRTKIIVWSSSAHSVNHAIKEFKDICDSLSDQEASLVSRYSRSSGNGGRDRPITIEFLDKRWTPYMSVY